jgi:hypothetical protein
MCYLSRTMTKADINRDATGHWVVRDSRSGRYLEIKGANSKPSDALPLKKGVDLTKPIARQALSGRFVSTRSRGGSAKFKSPENG